MDGTVIHCYWDQLTKRQAISAAPLRLKLESIQCRRVMQQMHVSVKTSCALSLQLDGVYANRGAVNRYEVLLNLVENLRKGFMESDIHDTKTFA